MPKSIEKMLIQTVPFSEIVHNDLPCYLEEGFGGAPIEVWPVFGFFKQYLDGDQGGAQKAFEDWYRNQLEKYHSIPNEKGGMRRGSLSGRIKHVCGAPFPGADDECVQRMIRERVRERLALLEGIRENGYKTDGTERIDAVRKNGVVYLRGGHHRAAALRVLGHDSLPGVLVFPNRITYNLFCLLRNIKYGFSK